MTQQWSRFAEVAVNATVPHRQTFSYAVPPAMDLAPGQAVYVPFGTRTLQGIVVEIGSTPVFSEPEKIRAVLAPASDTPLLDADRLALARWIAHRYVAPIYDAIALMLPPGFERRPETHITSSVAADEVEGLELPPRQRDVLLALARRGSVQADDLRRMLPGCDAALAALVRQGLAARQYRLARPAIGPKSVVYAALGLSHEEARARAAAAEPPRASRAAALIERLLEKRSISREEAARVAGSAARLEALVTRGTVRPDREGHHIELALAPGEALAEAEALRRTKRSAAAMAAIDALSGGERTLPDLRAAGIDSAAVRWLADAGVVHLREEAVERDPLQALDVSHRDAPALLPAQAAAAAALRRALRSGRAETFLLHGVTGSGKTEVYLDALDACVAAGKRAIVLVPDLALTPQTVRRFRERFARVAVLHSGLSGGEAYDQWHGIAAGRYDVVIGARSAIFAPQPDLALIVVDEEHEWTYKQHDPQPRYHARDVAIELARLKGATLVLGSATPDVVTYARATAEPLAFTLLRLEERVRPDERGVPQATFVMPAVHVVDLREELQRGNRSMFSDALRLSLKETLAAGEQAILFLNRRGLAGHVQCRDCGYVPQCASCTMVLTYHQQYDRLICHQCNRRQRLAARCRECGSPRVRLVGAGVEKLEAETARAFPAARLLRWDRDAARERGAHDRILEAARSGEADLLIGTQMLAKGLDLPSVTLVGVVNADVGLHVPDYRAAERTFQVLLQVAGRSGRGDKPGRVIIQTYQPDHYAIDAAARHDYEGFAERELAARAITHDPPAARLLRLVFAHPNARFAREEATRVQRILEARRLQAGAADRVDGPAPPYVPRVRGRWRWQLLLRGSDPAALVRDLVLPQGWSIDVDPETIA